MTMAPGAPAMRLRARNTIPILCLALLCRASLAATTAGCSVSLERTSTVPPPYTAGKGVSVGEEFVMISGMFGFTGPAGLAIDTVNSTVIQDDSGEYQAPHFIKIYTVSAAGKLNPVYTIETPYMFGTDTKPLAANPLALGTFGRGKAKYRGLVYVGWDGELYSRAIVVWDAAFALGKPVDVKYFQDTPRPLKLMTGDVNSDGLTDIILTGSTSDDPHPHWVLGTYLGTAAGDFTVGPVTPLQQVSTPPRMMLTGDVNGDGKLDVLYAYDRTVATYLGTGSGGFKKGPSTTLFSFIDGLQLADVTGDSKLDLVVSYRSISGRVKVRVLPGFGNATFAHGTEYTVGAPTTTHTWPSQVSVADFDEDGVADIAVLHTPTISILPGLGGGSFGPAYTASSAALDRYSIVADDFGGAGPSLAALDMAFPYKARKGSGVSIYQNQGC